MSSPNVDRFKFLSEALNGSGGFAPPPRADLQANPTGVVPQYDRALSYLVRYPRESLEKFARRRAVAWYTHDLRSACARFTGHLFSRGVSREIENPLLSLIRQDCDWRGNDLDVFWQSFTIEAKARGTMLLLIDMPRELPASQAEQIERRVVPYLQMITPESVNKIEVDDHGLVTMIELDHMVDTPAGQVRGVKVWDTTGWTVRVGERVYDEGEHGLGQCPVLAFYETEFWREGEFGQIADLSRRLFNLRSELDEILRSQTFSILTYPMPENAASSFNPQTMKDVAETIGTHNMVVHFGERPDFIAPPDGPAEIYLKTIERVEHLIRKVGHQIEAPDGTVAAESGIALEIRYQALNASLAHFARRMQDLEVRTWKIAAGWLGLPSPTDVSWPRTFQIADLAREIAVLQQMQAAGAPVEYTRAKMKRIVALDLGASAPEEVQDVQAAIDEQVNEREPGADPAGDPTDPTAGDPAPAPDADPLAAERLKMDIDRERIESTERVEQAKLDEQKRAEGARLAQEAELQREKLASAERIELARVAADERLRQAKIDADSVAAAAAPPAVAPAAPAPAAAPITMLFGGGADAKGQPENGAAFADALSAIAAAVAQMQASMGTFAQSIAADKVPERDAEGRITRVRTVQ